MFQQVVTGQNSSPCVTVSNVICSIDSRLHAVQFGMYVCTLQQEQLSHAETKLRLMEVTDKLDFTLGEVEILSKQLSKEKDAFQQMWVDSSSAPPGATHWL